jgi:hypothetical protein
MAGIMTFKMAEETEVMTNEVIRKMRLNRLTNGQLDYEMNM